MNQARTLLLILMLFLLACSSDKKDKVINTVNPEFKASSTMASYLADFRKNQNPLSSPYRNKDQAVFFKSKALSMSGAQKVDLEMRAAYQDLLAGDTQDAIDVFLAIEDMLEKLNNKSNEGIVRKLKEFIAVSYLRLGEQDNCQNNHSSESCILPLSESAVHTNKEGSSKAITYLTELLGSDPSNENYIYLINLAHMTLGTYPEGVPTKWYRKLKPDEKPLIKKFNNISDKLGLDDFRLSGGVVIDDFNNDNLPDVAISSWSLLDRIKIYYNRGNGVFEENNIESLNGITGGLNLIHTDYNNDGFLDLYILRGGWLKQAPMNSLLRNNGDESFTDVTHDLGLNSAHPTQTACWADFDLDGYVDLFVGNESTKEGVHPCELYINQKGEGFVNMADQHNAKIISYAKGVAASDYDNDGDMDIYISNIVGDNKLLKNMLKETGSLSFVDQAQQAGVTGPFKGFPCWFFDFNNDGWDDLFISGYSLENYNNFASEWSKSINGMEFNAGAPVLYLNQKDGTFKDISGPYGFNTPCFAMGANFGDLNNDNYPDIYLATGEPDYKAIIPNRMFLNDKGKYFNEVTTQGGFGHIQKGHAVSFADIDNDGDEDVYCVLGGAYEGDIFFNALFENPIQNPEWCKIKLIGGPSNKAAIGAKVHLQCSTASGGSIDYYKTVSNASSFGENPFTLNFSIPEGQSTESIMIKWPSGNEQKLEEIALNKLNIITEGFEEIEHIKLQSFNSSDLDSHAHHHH